MILTAMLALAVTAALAVAATTVASVWRHDPVQRHALFEALAYAIVAGSLHCLPPVQRERYREECAAGLADQRGPWQLLRYALETAAGAPGLTRTFGIARRPDSLLRRALAHLGFPVPLTESRQNSNASYVFDGAMRSRQADDATPQRRGE